MRPLILASVLLVLPAAAFAAEDPALRHARALLAATPLIDGHNDLPWAIRESETAPHDVAAYDLRSRTPGHTDLARMAAGHVGGQFWSVYVPSDLPADRAVTMTLEQIDALLDMVRRNPDRLELARSADDVERIAAAARVASMIGVEGGQDQGLHR